MCYLFIKIINSEIIVSRYIKFIENKNEKRWVGIHGGNYASTLKELLSFA